MVHFWHILAVVALSAGVALVVGTLTVWVYLRCRRRGRNREGQTSSDGSAESDRWTRAVTRVLKRQQKKDSDLPAAK